MNIKKKERNFSLSDGHLASFQKKRRLGLRVPASDDSQPIPNKRNQRNREEEQFETEIQLTVRTSIRLSRRQLCLVSALLLRELSEKGVNLNQLIICEYLLDRLLGQKQDPIFLKEEREREISLLLQSIIFGSRFLTLSEERVCLPEDVQELIYSSRFVPSKRTAGSWQNVYKIDKLLEVRSVRLDSIYEHTSNSTPYDSYCKGYGESHPSQHKQKTKFSSDLDRKEEIDPERERRSSLTLTEFYFYLTYQELERKYTGRIR